ncbi:MAG: hypothetical protein IT441_04140 [Phycisphaeraceae bacterium]|nr:hypothetical protein [Phycisphaeraceae bacterium]
MVYESYIANGLCRQPTEEDARRGYSEFRFFNPSDRAARIELRVYYPDRPPCDLPAWELEAWGNRYVAFPEHYAEATTDVGPWGMRVRSSERVMVDHILIAGMAGRAENLRFAGGVSDVLAKEGLSRRWVFGDGLKLEFDPAKAPLPFNEFEWFHLLNPGASEATVTMTCVYDATTRDTFELAVPAERVLMFDNREMARKNLGHGVLFESTSPVVIESTRLIYGLQGVEEWGAQIHTPRPGAAGW